MKNLSFSILLLAIALIGCKKEQIPDNLIVGNWQFISYDVQDLAGTTKKIVIPADKAIVISLTRNGEFNQEYKNVSLKEYNFMSGSNGGYKLEAPNIVRFFLVISSSLSGTPLTIKKITQKEMELSGQSGTVFYFKRSN